jgi:two-component system chemotaxis response regulator CheB
MPGLNGFQATKIIMEEQSTPIMIVSGHGAASEVSGAMEALRAGALRILPKPSGAGSPRFLSR